MFDRCHRSKKDSNESSRKTLTFWLPLMAKNWSPKTVLLLFLAARYRMLPKSREHSGRRRRSRNLPFIMRRSRLYDFFQSPGYVWSRHGHVYLRGREHSSSTADGEVSHQNLAE